MQKLWLLLLCTACPWQMSAQSGHMSASDEERIVQNLVANMVYVPGGTFTMGALETDAEAGKHEKPAHRVTLSSFYIGKYEVTQEEWEAVMGGNPSGFKGSRHPVERVSWQGCQEFISKLNEKTGKRFRLPTEAEWEFAARGGNRSQGYKYSGSDSLDEVGWYGGNCNDANGDGTTHTVGMKHPNELGLYDMSGNVWEWCSDGYGDYDGADQINPTGASSGIGSSNRVVRGGSWMNYYWYCRVSDRFDIGPDFGIFCIGLRLVLVQ
jgi:formylglycine-generating enzyme required for sulfatase activity